MPASLRFVFWSQNLQADVKLSFINFYSGRQRHCILLLLPYKATHLTVDSSPHPQIWTTGFPSRTLSVSEAQKTSRRDLKVAFRAALVAQMEKNPPAAQEAGVWFLSREDPLEKTMQPTPAFLPGESHVQRSLAGYSPWGCKELAMTGWLTLSLYLM